MTNMKKEKEKEKERMGRQRSNGGICGEVGAAKRMKVSRIVRELCCYQCWCWYW